MSMSINAHHPGITQLPQTSAARSNTGYDQSAYLKELNSRVKAPVLAGVWNGKSPFAGSTPTVMIHPDYLRQMHDDPALGASIEEQINIYADAADAMARQEAAKGNRIVSQGMYIDENGGMSGYSQYEMVSDGGGLAKPAASAKEMMEELQRKIREKQEQEAESAEKLEEKRQREQQLLSSLQAEITVEVNPAAAHAPDAKGTTP